MKTKIIYLGHSGFLVETNKYYLFFDYVKSSPFKNEMFIQHEIDFNNYIDKPIFMFCSHNHFDHYGSDLHKKLENNKNITFVLGDIETNLKNSITIKPRETKILCDLTVYAADSTDMGVCFLIDADGLIIYHGGDNTAWSDDYNNLFKTEVDYLSEIKNKVDIAFLPVCNYYGKRYPSITNAAFYSIKAFNPKLVVPMHNTKGVNVYEDFKNDAEKNNFKNKVVCMNMGDEFLF